MAKSHGEEIAIGFMIGIFLAILLGLLYTNNIFIDKYLEPIPSNSTPMYFGNFVNATLLESNGVIRKWEVTNHTSSDLIAYYNMDLIINNTIIDNSGNGNTGIIYGAILTTGYYNNAIYFDGINDYITVVNLDEYPNNKGLITICLWLKFTIPSNGKQLIGWWYNNNNRIKSANIGEIEFNIDADSFNTSISNTLLNDGNWHYIVGTYNSTGGTNNVKLYVDSVLQTAQGTTTGNMKGAGDLFGIGGLGSGNNFFGGVIDEVRIYDKALNSSEVNQLYYNLYGLNYYEIWDGSTLKHQGLIEPNIGDFTSSLILLSITELQFIVIILWLLIGIVVWSFRS